VPCREHVGSDVELVDVNTGVRRAVYRVDDSIHAPNRTPDRKRLLMNRNGRTYRLDLATWTISDLDTGSMTGNNNDRALSFDGKTLGLSGSRPAVVAYIYGGQGSMNVNSWSPDSRSVAFVCNSGGEE
jgi:Tol biopolymer transport system component